MVLNRSLLRSTWAYSTLVPTTHLLLCSYAHPPSETLTRSPFSVPSTFVSSSRACVSTLDFQRKKMVSLLFALHSTSSVLRHWLLSTSPQDRLPLSPPIAITPLPLLGLRATCVGVFHCLFRLTCYLVCVHSAFSFCPEHRRQGQVSAQRTGG